MALTLQQRADVRNALGWSAQFSQTDNALENAFDGLDSNPEHETQVVALLADIASIKTKLTAAHSRLSVIQTCDIKMDPLRTEIAGLRWEGMRLTGELASIMGVERRHNIFGSGTPGRVDWHGPIGFGGGHSNFIG